VPYDFQVAFDCADSHALADWWAETLDWVVEEQDADFIHRMIAEGYATEADTATHNGRLVWRDGAAIRHPDGPATGYRRRIIFQQVPEPKTAKNRVHFDLRAPGPMDEEVARLEALGALVLRRLAHSVMMADPEGNEFCVEPGPR
jgi:Glyoxalase-like domain